MPTESKHYRERIDMMGDELPDPAEGAGEPVWLQYRAQFHDYARAARHNRVRYQVSQAAIIVAASAITVVAAFSADARPAAVLGALVAVLGGLQQLGRWQAQWVDYRRAAEEMRRHGFAYVARTAPYAGEGRRELLAQHRRDVALGENRGWTARTGPQSRP